MKPPVLCVAVFALTVAGFWPSSPARADGHLPIIDIIPISTFAAAGGVRDSQTVNGPTVGAPVNGALNVAGTVTGPLLKGFSAAYDRIINGVFHQTYDQVIIPGVGAVQPGSYNDVIQQYRLDEVFHRFTLEGGAATRFRMCCPGSGDPNTPVPSTEWHQLFLGLTYASHPVHFLHDSSFVLNITGHSANHNPSPASLAFEQQLSPGIVDIRKHEYGTTQAVTLAQPIDAKHGFTATGTFTWGSFDYLENYPYPLNYDVWVFTASKQFSKVFGIELRQANLWQRPNQNTPFLNNAIHVVEWSAIANFHVNLNP